MRLSFCTLTGVDEHTDLNRLVALSKTYLLSELLAEWGFLYSPKRQGDPGRYPSEAFLRQALTGLPDHVNVALHVCGDGVMDLLTDSSSVAAQLVDLVAARGGRVQLNFNQRRKPVPIPMLERLAIDRPTTSFILQYNDANQELVDYLQHLTGSFSVLHDASGGNGAHPEQWPAIVPGFNTGYAGGLGSATLPADLRAIAAAAGQARIWIDMESSLRRKDANDVDWFSLDECEACLAIAERWQLMWQPVS